MVVVAIGARGRVRLVLLAGRALVRVHNGALVVGQRGGVGRQCRHLGQVAVAGDAGGLVHGDDRGLGGRLVAHGDAVVHLGQHRLIGMAGDAGHTLGLVGHTLGTGGIGRRRRLGGMAGDAVGLHRPVHRLTGHSVVAAGLLLGGGGGSPRTARIGRGSTRRAAHERAREGRHGEHRGDDGRKGNAARRLRFTFHGILLSSRSRLAVARRGAAASHHERTGRPPYLLE